MSTQPKQEGGAGRTVRTVKVQRGAFLEMATEEVALPNGHHATLDLIRHPGASAIVPFVDAACEEVLLIRQYRHAAGGTIYEVPAGKLDPGEPPDVCAQRELEEETGRRAGRLVALGSILTTPGFTDERIYLYAAFDLAPGEQRLEDCELIELVPMRLDAALELVFRGELPDAKSAMALVLAARHLGRL